MEAKTTAELSIFGEWHEEVVWSLLGVAGALTAWLFYREFFGGGLIDDEQEDDDREA